MSNEARDQDKAAAVFRQAVAILEESSFDYAVGGGLATAHWTGGADRIADIDVLIREDDASEILKQLDAAGYEVTEMEHSWLHKAFKNGTTVDLMFELKNGTRFDGSFQEHRKRAEMFGSRPYVMAPEDQVATLAATVDREAIGDHWYSIIDIMSNNDLDWPYLITRSQRIPLRMLGVLYFALSEKVPVQKGVIEQLVELAAASG
ncbi:MAG: nucleotidyltransferase family protein [Actinomycetota bacterium]